MPYACLNSLTLSHHDPIKLHEAFAALAEGRLLAYFCPEPDYDNPHVVDLLAEQYSDDLAAALNGMKATREEVRDRLRREWRLENWSTTEDVRNRGVPASHGDHAHLAFLSNGNPPINAYRHAVVRHGFSLTASYHEEQASLAGEYDYCDHQGERHCEMDVFNAVLPRNLAHVSRLFAPRVVDNHHDSL